MTAGVKEHMASGDPRLGVADSWRRSDVPTKSKEDDTKPTLYHTDTSYYSQVLTTWQSHLPDKDIFLRL